MKFKPAAIFSDHMVLQRNKPIAVFGEGEKSTLVKVILDYVEKGIKKNLERETAVTETGRWLLHLPALSAVETCTLTISCEKDTLCFHDIAIGEVWLCGGQSNMEYELQNMTGGAKHLTEDAPNVRFYQVPRNAYKNETFYEAENNSCWQEFDPESAKTWSAAGYLFGKQLSEALGVTVGLVGCNWGGTSASAWMSREQLASDEDAATYLADYEKAVEGKDPLELMNSYDEYLVFEKDWNEKCSELYATVPGITWDEVQERIGECQWPGPMCAKHPFRPSGLYETMVQRIVPYSMQGFLYYQGESDDHKPHSYAKLMELLIRQWRTDWKDESMPFLYVQLPGHRYIQDEDRKHWCILREMQELVSKSVANTGMAVLIDAGEFNDIHPKNKIPVADRLYRQAMYRVYHEISEEEACAPLYKSCEITKNQIIIDFFHADNGLVCINSNNNGTSLSGFEVAGEDRVYSPAAAHIHGRQVIVDASSVADPKAVRYLWTNYPEYKINLYNSYGLPAAPFRTEL